MVCGIDNQSCKIISIVVGVCVTLAALDIAWTYFGPCKADIMLMMDDSGSISDQNFEKVKNFINDLSDNKNIKDQLDDHNIQIGMSTFSHCAKWMDQTECGDQHGLTFVHNAYSIKKTLRDYTRMKSITDMVQALEFVDAFMLKEARPDTDKILLFMTDGKSEDAKNLPQSIQQIGKTANKLKEQGVEIFVIAVGDEENFRQQELETISSSTCEASGEDGGRVCKDSDKFIIKVADFKKLEGIVEELASHVCNHQYWMAAIPLVIAVVFVIVKLLLNRREASKLDTDVNQLNDFKPGLTV